MSLLRVECGGCGAALQVRPEMAGRQGRCPKCGGAVQIPADAPAMPTASAAARSPDRPPSGWASPDDTVIGRGDLPLAQATGPDVMAEIARRQKSAVLIVFETPTDGAYNISERPAANVRCFRTPDMNEAQLMEVLGELGRMTQGQPNPKGGVGLNSAEIEVPFELKGDRLGMSLADFKAKYARTIGAMNLPFTSESTPGQANSSLWSEPWHARAGIVHARVDLPSENNSPTLAGVKTELFLYHFVDGQLFRITVLFDTEAFHLVREAMVQKYGLPDHETKDPMELSWENLPSSLRLVRGTMRPKKWSTLLAVHHELQLLADERLPQRDADL
jgi:hypothetical protein